MEMIPSTVTTIYDQGVLYPLEPLTLPNATKIQVQIMQGETPTQPTMMQANYLTRLRDTLPKLAHPWSEDLIYQAYVNIFRNDLITLWQLSISLHSELCAMLMLALQAIHTERLSTAQIDVIKIVLDKIELVNLSQADINQCHLKLLDVHLFLTVSLDDNALQSYIDEL